ncbi:MAG: hypothetical protein SOU27_01010 [Sodaliphilus sp.]|nr:hypothetical protein [Sodaliphilus sp.]
MTISKITKLKICNSALIVTAVLTLASSVQMEACGGSGIGRLSFPTLMWIHCASGTLMFLCVFLHLRLHFGTRNWLSKIKRLPKRPTRFLCILFAIMILTSLLALGHTIPHFTHTPVGAIHGKIGFLFLLLCIAHTAKRFPWLKKHLFSSSR